MFEKSKKRIKGLALTERPIDLDISSSRILFLKDIKSEIDNNKIQLKKKSREKNFLIFYQRGKKMRNPKKAKSQNFKSSKKQPTS